METNFYCPHCGKVADTTGYKTILNNVIRYVHKACHAEYFRNIIRGIQKERG